MCAVPCHIGAASKSKNLDQQLFSGPGRLNKYYHQSSMTWGQEIAVDGIQMNAVHGRDEDLGGVPVEMIALRALYNL
jgi:hypothetical protein